MNQMVNNNNSSNSLVFGLWQQTKRICVNLASCRGKREIEQEKGNLTPKDNTGNN